VLNVDVSPDGQWVLAGEHHSIWLRRLTQLHVPQAVARP
jgi:hypothetical protein